MEDEVLNTVEEVDKVYNIKHRAYLFAKETVLYVSGLEYDRIHFSIFDQLIRSATSIGANLVEGRAGSSKNDFLKFYIIALKSANETKYWLCLIRDSLELDKDYVKQLLNEADEISKIIAKIIMSTKAG